MELEQRIERLEQENRGWRRGGALVLAFVACVLLMGQGKGRGPQDLVVKSLAIEDKAGRTRVWLSLSDEGAPFLTLWDGKKIRASLSLSRRGSPGLSLIDKHGGQRMVMSLTGLSDPYISMMDRAGKTRAVVGLSHGSPSVRLRDGRNRDRAVLGVTSAVDKKGTPENTLTLYDAKGDVLWQQSR